MRVLVPTLALVALLAAPPVSAGSATCEGFAPTEDECEGTFTVTTGAPSSSCAGATFTGWINVFLTNGSGEYAVTWWLVAGTVVDTEPLRPLGVHGHTRGEFVPGDEVAYYVVAVGAGAFACTVSV